MDTLSIEYNVTANPPANIIWLIRTTEGVKNVLSTSKKNISQHYESDGFNGPTLRSILVVRNVLQTDSGQYICEAVSELFKQAISVNFSVSVAGELTLS